LRKALEGISDEVEVRLSSDTGVDQGEGEIIVESATHVKYNTENFGLIEYFSIYANDHDYEEDEDDE
ncbi:hypothetical protein LJC58_06900, partial [Lachnospiraceae bacterium OttesenSCG-928-D06]|nr:hypothetical protein [Lachnospiraceae bacterium OttesenSCG-928-D06]